MTLPWGAVVASAGIDVQLTPRVRLWADAEAGLALNQAEIVVDNLESLHQVGLGLGRGSLGFALRI